MGDELPTEFDCIVVGTGMTECIIAAALARIGKRVLHVDRNDYYGGAWASFNLDGIRKWIAKYKGEAGPLVEPEIPEFSSLLQYLTLNKKKEENTEPLQEDPEPVSLTKEGETLLDVPLESDSVRNVVERIYVRLKAKEREQTSASDEIVADEKVTCDELTSTEPTSSFEPEPASSLTGPEPSSSCVELGVSEDLTKGEAECDQKQVVADPVKSVDESSQLGAQSETPPITQTEVMTSDSTEKEESELSIEEPRGISDVANVNFDCGDATVVKESETNTEDVEDDKANDSPISENQPVLSVAVAVEPGKKEWSWESLHREWRRFNLDLTPKLLFSRGSLVELLVSSNVARYAEFKILNRVLTMLNDQLERVPCSRADVFSNKKVTVVEKRMLMKFIQFCLGYEREPEKYADWSDRPYSEFLKSQKLTFNLQHYILHSIAMVSDLATTMEGLVATKRFLHSLGRFGNSPFLWPMYGSGELPQCFCRLCAVFGGVYCLRRMPRQIMVNSENQCTGIICNEGQRIECQWLVMESSYAPREYSTDSETSQCYSRAILITNKSMLDEGSEDRQQVTLLNIPALQDGWSPVNIIELGPSTMACPRGTYVVHMRCQALGNAELDFQPIIQKLFQVSDQSDDTSEEDDTEQESADTRPKVLWAVYFNVTDTTEPSAAAAAASVSNNPDNVIICSGPDCSLDFEHAVQEAKALFTQMCPDEEFLPRAPDPEEIVFGEDENTTPTDGFQELPTDGAERSENNDTLPPPDPTHGRPGTNQNDNGGGGFYENREERTLEGT